MCPSNPPQTAPSHHDASPEEEKRLEESLGLAHGGLDVQRSDVLPLDVSRKS